MARGPSPKHPSARQRRNRTATATTLVPVDRNTLALPPLPEQYRRVEGELIRREWHPEAKLAWVELWSSPMASEYAAADIPLIHVYVGLIQDVAERREGGKSFTEAAAELRQYAAMFGISPDARRRLQWTIEQAEEAMARGRKRELDEQDFIEGTAIDVEDAWSAIEEGEEDE